MPYALVIDRTGNARRVVASSPFQAERDLHEAIKANPEVLPTEDLFGEDEAQYVIGYEPRLDTKYADLVAVNRAGRLSILEFKLDRNHDSRQVLAQLIEYAARLTGWTYAEFEDRVVRRYFEGDHCPTRELRGKSLVDAIRLQTGSVDEGWAATFTDTVKAQLATGDLRLVVVADDVDEATLKSVAWLRRRGVSEIHAVAVRRFIREGLEVLVPTAMTGPQAAVPRASSTVSHPSGQPFDDEALAECQAVLRANQSLDEAYKGRCIAFMDALDVCLGALRDAGLVTTSYVPVEGHVQAVLGVQVPALGRASLVRCGCQPRSATGLDLLWNFHRLERQATGSPMAGAVAELRHAVLGSLATDAARDKLATTIERGGDEHSSLSVFSPGAESGLLAALGEFCRAVDAATTSR